MSHSELGLKIESEFDDLDLSLTDNEEDVESCIPATNTRKRHAPRKWRPYGFDPKNLEFFDRLSGVNEEFKVGGNKPTDYFRGFFDGEPMQKIVEEANNYQE